MHEGEHPHVHSFACGHETRKHGDHEDFEHDGHWHAKDGEHYDEHGDVTGPMADVMS
jgi:zinc transport system permease protein